VRALRLRPSDRLSLFDGQGGSVEARLLDLEKQALVEPVQPAVFAPFEGPRWTVAVACVGLDRKRTDWAVEKLTELGVFAFVPLLTAQTQLGKKDRERVALGDVERWRRVSREACKQSQRLHFPQVHDATTLDALLTMIRDAPVALVALQGGQPLRQALEAGPSSQGGLILVGPPGDFSNEEKAAIVLAGALPVSLGTLRLRTETAAIALLCCLQNSF
jgi:16S rRNA (uracil1498-N3)-methyltransferase